MHVRATQITSLTLRYKSIAPTSEEMLCSGYKAYLQFVIGGRCNE
jgi:hypothetical protein